MDDGNEIKNRVRRILFVRLKKNNRKRVYGVFNFEK